MESAIDSGCLLQETHRHFSGVSFKRERNRKRKREAPACRKVEGEFIAANFVDDDFGSWVDASNIQLGPLSREMDYLLNLAVEHYNNHRAGDSHEICHPQLLATGYVLCGDPMWSHLTFAAYSDDHVDKLGVYQVKLTQRFPVTNGSYVHYCQRKDSSRSKTPVLRKLGAKRAITARPTIRKLEINEELERYNVRDREFGPYVDASAIQLGKLHDDMDYLLNIAVKHYNDHVTDSHKICKPQLLTKGYSLLGDPVWVYLTFAAYSEGDVASAGDAKLGVYQAKVTQRWPVTDSYVHVCWRKGN